MARSIPPTERQVFIAQIPPGYTNDKIRKGLKNWPPIEEIFHDTNSSWANLTLKSEKAQKKVLNTRALHVLDGKHALLVKPFESRSTLVQTAKDGHSSATPPPPPPQSGVEAMGDTFKLFVGGIPYDFDESDVRKSIESWGNVVHVSLPPSRGAAFVTFATHQDQQRLLKAKDKHKIGNKFVDVKPYLSKGVRQGLGGPQRVPEATGAVPKTSQSQIPVNRGQLSAVLVQYVGNRGQFGIVVTNDQRKGILHANSVCVCRKHGLRCIDATCPDYRLYTETEGLSDLIGVNTIMIMVIRPLEVEDCPYVFQAIVAWPALSTFPSNLVEPSGKVLDDHIMEIMKHPTCFLKTNVRERSSSQAPEATPRTQRRKRNLSESSRKANSASESSQKGPDGSGNEIETTDGIQMLSQISDLALKRDDLMRYLSKIRTIKEFFQVHFNQAPLENILRLAQKIMQVDVKRRQIVSRMLVSKFIKANDIEISDQKLQNIMALFKVLLHPFSQETDVDNKIAEKMANQEHTEIIQQVLSNTTPKQISSVNDDIQGASSQSIVASSGGIEQVVLSLESVSLASIESFEPCPGTEMIPKFGEESRRKFQDIYDWVTHFYKNPQASVHFKPDDVGKAIVNSLVNASLDKQQVVNDKKCFLTQPLIILTSYANYVDEYFNSRSRLMVSREFIVHVLALYFWNSNPLIAEVSGKGQSHPTLTSILSATIVSQSRLTNVRGIVIQYLNKSVGLVVTPFGMVFFDIRLALTRADGDWIRCQYQNQMPVGSMVKMHCMIVGENEEGGKQKSPFLVAFKVWPLGVEDVPYTGLWLPGGSKFWKTSLAQFSKIVEANPQLKIKTEVSQKEKKVETDLYDKYFENFMKKAYGEMKTSSAVSKANLEGAEPTYKTAIAFFKNRVNDPSMFIKAVNTVRVLALRNIPLHDLRKCFMASKFLGSVDIFVEALELILISPGSSIFYGPDFDKNVCNIVGLIKAFFEEGDPVVEGQITENQKKISSNPLGSKMRIANILEACNCFNPYKFISKPLMISDQSYPAHQSSQVRPQSQASPINLAAISLDDDEDDLQRQILALMQEVAELRSWKEEITQRYDKFGEDITKLLTLYRDKIANLEEKVFQNQTIDRTGATIALSQRNNVKVCQEGQNETYSFQLLKDGNLSVSSISAIFPNISCLIYRHENTLNIQVLAKCGEIFLPPEDGWGDRIYIAKLNAPQQPFFNQSPPFTINPNPHGLLYRPQHFPPRH